MNSVRERGPQNSLRKKPKMGKEQKNDVLPFERFKFGVHTLR